MYTFRILVLCRKLIIWNIHDSDAVTSSAKYKASWSVSRDPQTRVNKIKLNERKSDYAREHRQIERCRKRWRKIDCRSERATVTRFDHFIPRRRKIRRIRWFARQKTRFSSDVSHVLIQGRKLIGRINRCRNFYTGIYIVIATSCLRKELYNMIKWYSAFVTSAVYFESEYKSTLGTQRPQHSHHKFSIEDVDIWVVYDINIRWDLNSCSNEFKWDVIS